jgi:hypothetical protein
MCCGRTPDPAVRQEGNLVSSWGGPGQGYDWPDSNHGITIDYKGYVWIGGNGQGYTSGELPPVDRPHRVDNSRR